MTPGDRGRDSGGGERVVPTPEYRYVLDLATSFVSGDAPAPPPAGLRGRHLLDLLARHRLTLTLGPAIVAGALPTGLRTELVETLHVLRARHGWYSMELGRALSALEGSGCTVLVLKGGALNATVYKGRAPRYVSDLDVLVRRRDLTSACSVLEGLGYRPSMDRRTPEYYEKHHFHWIFRNEAGVTIEVHWQLARPDDWVAFDVEGVFARARRVGAGSHAIPMPSDVDHLLHTAFQALCDGFWNLRRFVDAALLLEAGAAEDPALAGLARDCRLRSALWMLLVRTRELLSVSVSAAVLDELAPKTVTRTCLRTVIPPDYPSQLERVPDVHQWVHWLCAPSLGDAISALGRFTFPTRLEIVGERGRFDGSSGFAWHAYVVGRRVETVARLLGRQTWRLASRTGSEAASGPAKKKAGAEAPAS